MATPNLPNGFSEIEDWLIAIAKHTRDAADSLKATKRQAKVEREQGSAQSQMLSRLERGIGRLIAAAGVTSVAKRGFGGTVESARLDYAMEQLSRQLAAVFMPIINAATYAAVRLERGFRGMSGTSQNRMMGMMGGMVAGGMMGGPFGAVAGAGIGSALFGLNRDMSDTTRAAAIGGSAYAGYRVGGPAGAIAGVGAAAIGTSSDYERLRTPRSDGSGRSSMFVAGMASMGMGVSDLMQAAIYSGETPNDKKRREFDAANPRGRAAEAPRRDVTPFQSEMGEAGSGYFRMQQATIRATAGADFEDAGPLKPIVDIGIEIVKLLAKIAGVEWTETPRSAEATRGDWLARRHG